MAVPEARAFPSMTRPPQTEIFSTIWAEHKKRLYSLCLRWLGGDAPDAEDVLSEVALRAVQEQSENAVISNYAGWLTRLAWNLCMDKHRERAYQHKTMERLSAEGHLDAPCVERQPEMEHLQREMGAQLQRAIERLPLRLREPCELRFIEEMPYELVAERLGLTNETVRKRIQEAREILERRLSGYLGVTSKKS